MEAQELIRELPKGLINWYEFERNCRALFVTGGILTREAMPQDLQEEIYAEALREAGFVLSVMSAEEILRSNSPA